MSSASYLHPSNVEIAINHVPQFTPAKVPMRPRPMTSVTASAQRITSRSLKQSRGSGRSASSSRTAGNWQQDAWEMYDLVGEQRFLVDVLAGRLAQAKFYVGELSDNLTEDPSPTEDQRLTQVLDEVGEGLAGRSQLIRRLGVHLLVPGEGWLIGVPSKFLSVDERNPLQYQVNALDRVSSLEDLNTETIEDLTWAAYSLDEVKFPNEGQVDITMQDGKVVTGSPDDFFIVRVWNSHPRKAWEATSPTKASLPVLRELVGLTMHISAQVDSRLAGAGVLIVPSSAVKAMRQQLGLGDDSTEDPFTEALMDAMLTPIEDRANASAVVPLVITVPDESADKFQHISFDRPLDNEAKELRDEAIRRLALGQDAPPELLLGTGGMNHWGAWLVREDVVTTHLEPPLALICDALTTQYLRPVMEALGYDKEDIKRHVVWYDVADLITRPNRGGDAERLYEKGVLSDEALRAATGFDEADAPETAHMGVAELAVLDLIKRNPDYITNFGVKELVEQFQALVDGRPMPWKDPFAEEDESGLPEDDFTAPEDDLQGGAEDIAIQDESFEPGAEVGGDVSTGDEAGDGGLGIPGTFDDAMEEPGVPSL